MRPMSRKTRIRCPLPYFVAAGGFTFAIVRPTVRLVMSWSVANGKYLCYTLSSLAAVRRGDGTKTI
jgi:hypothetical protein